MVDPGGDDLVLDGIVEPPHLGQGPFPLGDELVDLRVAGGFGLLLGLGLGFRAYTLLSFI